MAHYSDNEDFLRQVLEVGVGNAPALLGIPEPKFKQCASSALAEYEQKHEHILRALAPGNPVFLCSRCDFVNASLRSHRLLSFLSKREYIYGDSDRVGAAFGEIPGRINQYQLPKVVPVSHVFPVYLPSMNTGFVIPVRIETAEEWQISDVFTALAFSDDSGISESDAVKSFRKLLELIATTWKTIEPETVLPLQWRRAFKISLLVPIHLELVQGRSLQLPLLIAVLRAFASISGEDPFQGRPVFATGTVDAMGCFGDVCHEKEKLAGFVREFGNDCTAILTERQADCESLSKDLAGMTVLKAENLKELLELPEFRNPLKSLCAPPHPTEMDQILTDLSRLKGKIRFRDISNAANWLLKDLKSPVYRFHLLLETAKTELHRGRFARALTMGSEADAILNGSPGDFGAHDQVELAVFWADFALDAGETNLGLSKLKNLQDAVQHATAYERVAYYGMMSQAYRAAGEWEDAVTCGRKAVRLADLARAADSGRDRNYLIHALIARVRAGAGDAEQDLAEAETLLSEAKTTWAPQHDASTRMSHLGFCCHLEAEIARLRGKAFALSSHPQYHGSWEHPVLFTALSCARNWKNTNDERVVCIDFAIRGAQERAGSDPISLFQLFHYVYRGYRAYLLSENIGAVADHIDAWTRAVAESNKPDRELNGWRDRLAPYLSRLRKHESDAVEDLCDAIPYH